MQNIVVILTIIILLMIKNVLVLDYDNKNIVKNLIGEIDRLDDLLNKASITNQVLEQELEFRNTLINEKSREVSNLKSELKKIKLLDNWMVEEKY